VVRPESRKNTVARGLRTALLLASLYAPLAHAGSITAILTAPDRAAIALDRALLRSIFLLRLREWPDGVPARIFVLPDDSELSQAFCREQLGTYPYVLRAAWDRAVFTGTGLAPTLVTSEDEMRRRVLTTPGAIGYIHSGGSDDKAPGEQP
jgi:hypothetical protein